MLCIRIAGAHRNNHWRNYKHRSCDSINQYGTMLTFASAGKKKEKKRDTTTAHMTKQHGSSSWHARTQAHCTTLQQEEDGCPCTEVGSCNELTRQNWKFVQSWYCLLRNMLSLLYLPNSTSATVWVGQFANTSYSLQGHTYTTSDGSTRIARVIVSINMERRLRLQPQKKKKKMKRNHYSPHD